MIFNLKRIIGSRWVQIVIAYGTHIRDAFSFLRLFPSRTFDDFADFLGCNSPNSCADIHRHSVQNKDIDVI